METRSSRGRNLLKPIDKFTEIIILTDSKCLINMEFRTDILSKASHGSRPGSTVAVRPDFLLTLILVLANLLVLGLIIIG